MISDEILEVLSRRLKLHIEDYIGTEKCWEEEINLLTRDMAETIKFIENECDDETFYWISEVFEDIAAKTQNIEFVEAIKRRAEKMIDDEQRHSVETDIRYAEYELPD